MTSKVIYFLDGPSRGRERKLRIDSSTMEDIQFSDGSWGVYDTFEGHNYATRQLETGLFVVDKDGIMFGVTETSRYRWPGVL